MGLNISISSKNKDKTPDERLQDIIHRSLECRWSIGQAERHDQKLELAVVDMKSCIGDVVRMHAHDGTHSAGRFW